MKRFVSLICVLALALGCMGDLTPIAMAAGDAAPASAGSVTYYVSTSGKGGNTGLSEASPLPGLSAVPWDQLLPGDSVLLKKGDVFPGFIRLVDVHGESGNPITIGSYGSGSAPRIEAGGQGIWLQETGSTASVGKYASAGVLLYDCSYITVSGLDISNKPAELKTTFEDAPGQSDRSGVSDHSDEKLPYAGVAVAADGVGAADGIVLENLTVHDADEAVMTETSSTVTQTNVTAGAASPASSLTQTAGTYYVSSLNGSDSNDGSSPDQAFYSLHKINAMDLGPGAKIYLERGSVFEDQYLHFNGSGADGNPIIVDAYGSESDPKPLINTNGQGVWYQNYRQNLDNSGHVRHGYVSSSVLIYDVEYIEVKNIAMTNFGRYGETPGADFANLGSYDGGTVPGETGYSTNGNTVGTYTWGGKMSRTGVAGVSQNVGTMDHVYLQNLDIENVYGNIMHKHMDNGGIYFTMSAAIDEAETGIPKYDDLRIEGCYLYRTSRWGIAAAYTGAYHSKFNGAAISDETAEKYGVTNLYIGHNYIEEVGGDPITTMYAYEPLIEYNVALNGGREMSSVAGVSNYMNGTHIYNNRGDVSAGIWPWKCKTALFEHNECYDMLYGRVGTNGGIGNNDAQAWDADYGDSTIYQYNYSSGNTGGCVMFCYTEAYNTVFRYNISYKDGMPGNDRGVLDMSSNANGQVTNNTFVMVEDTLVHRGGHAGPAQVENNIFYNLGDAYNPSWNANGQLTYNNNIYAGFGSKPSGNSGIQLDQNAALFAGDVSTAPEAPKSTSKAGVGTVNGIRSWAHDWSTDFNMFKLAESGDNAAINAGVPHNYTGLAQDSDFGVPRVANDKDFYGSTLDDIHDMGAHDTLTAGGTLPTNSGNELLSSVFEVRNTTEIHVPFTTNNPMTVEAFAAGLTVSKGASVKVLDGTTEKAAGDNIAANMTVKIVAQDGAENSTVYTIKAKNDYAHKADFVANQQGNVWFHQVRDAETGALVNLTSFSGGAQGWWTGGNNTCAEYNGAADDDRNVTSSGAAAQKYNGSGFVFRAPATGKVTVSFPEQPKFRYGKAFNNSFDTYVAVYHNGQLIQGTKTLIPKPSSASGTPASVSIASFDLTVVRGDTIEFMVVNEGTFTSIHSPNSGDVLFNTAVSYKNEDISGIEIPADTVKPVMGSVWVSGITQTGATAVWDAATDNRGVIANYKVAVDGAAAQVTNELSLTLTGLEPGTEHTVTVIAVDAAGNESVPASKTFTTKTAPQVVEDTTAPTAPTNGQTVGTTQKTATIQWTASTDDVGVAGYEVTVDGRTEIVRNITQCTLTDLEPATQYTASVAAFDAAGNKSSALSIAFTTAAPDTTAPAAPTGLTVLGITFGKATVRWTASTDNVGVAGYQVKVDDGAEQDVGNVLQYTLTGLDLYTEYTVSVRAYDEAGNLSPWAQVTFTSAGSSDNRLIASVYEVRDNAFQVPYTPENPMTLANFVAGLEIPGTASVKVYNGAAEVTEGNVTEGMTVKIIAQDGTENATAYTIQNKNTYNHHSDWVNNQQGNVWFSQYRTGNAFYDWESSRWNAGGWYVNEDAGYASAERVGACDDIRIESQKTYQGSGFTFRAPATGAVTVSFPDQPVFRNAKCTENTFTTYLVIYKNGVQIQGKKFEIPKTTTASVSIAPFNIAMKMGDTLEFMIVNEGSTKTGGQGGVAYTPQVAYADVEVDLPVDSITLSQTAATIYTNADDPGHTLTLTADVQPENAADRSVIWTTSNQAAATVENGVVTAHAVGMATITATAADGSGVSASCVVTVRTKLVNQITISGTAKFGSTLTADINQLQMPDADKNQLTYQWHRGGTDISGAVNQTYTLVKDDIGQTISVTVTALSPYEGTRTASITGVVQKADGPEVIATLDFVNCTSGNDDDGKIIGLNPERIYEYKLFDATEWTPIPANSTEVTGLRPGDYVVRVKETDTHTAGPVSRTLTILGHNESGYEIRIADRFDGGVLRVQRRQPAEGTVITIYVTPDEGFQLAADSLKVTKDSGGEVETTPTDEGNYTFTMPAEAVTITARFEKQTFTLTHALTNMSCSMEGDHAHVVEYGDTPTITLTPDEGYQVPTTVTITDTDTGAAFTAYTYRYNANMESGVITFTGGIAANLTITGTAAPKRYTIAHNLTNLSCDLGNEDQHVINHGQALSITLIPAVGYQLPATVSITMNDEPFNDFTYSSRTGVITIAEGKITGHLTITAVGVEEGTVVDPPAPPVNPGTPSTPSTPPTTTEIKDNGDGTTTTIVTDNTTGTVTETTEKADGTVEIVETQKDGTVTETTTDPEGGKVEKITNPEKDVAITVTDKDGEVLAEVELPAEIPASETRFVDVPVGHWADEAIHNMAALEVVNGVGNDLYDMNGNMTRGALATVLSRLSNGQEGLDAGFVDVAAGQWYADGIAWAAKTGVVTGYSETEFGPNDPITREQLAVMLCRYARLLGMDTTTDTGALGLFSDGGLTHDWAAESVAWCVERGILQGKGSATLAPTATATRAEVAVMLQRFIGLMK